MMSGIYALVRIDGGPVDARDAAALGLSPPVEGVNMVARAIDHLHPQAVDSIDDADALTLVAGWIEDGADLAARLQLPADTRPAQLARAALLRFADETPAEMIGEYTLLHWHKRDRRLQLMLSAGVRDRIFVARRGPVIAVAPDLMALRRLPWMAKDIDETGLLFALGRAQLRDANAGRTVLAGVGRIEAGGNVTVSTAAVRHGRSDALTVQPRWQGSFADAMAEVETLLRRIVRSRLARVGTGATTLSGGLDSSTLAWLAANERPSGQALLLLTSVAPPECGEPDEREAADAVAAALGLTGTHLYPDDAIAIYRPRDALFVGSNGPPLLTRHCLIEIFQSCAAAHGAQAMFVGGFGEMTLSVKQPTGGAYRWLRRQGSALRRRLAQGPASPAATGDFHVRLAPHRLAGLPDAVREALTAPSANPAMAGDAGLWGYRPGAAKALLNPTEVWPGAVRDDFPYRDVRLLRLFAGFPANFMTHGGVMRAPVRHLLRGHLPDSIRLRTSGRPASPGHLHRLRRQAAAAQARIPALRKAGIDDWIDLDWLDLALANAASRSVRSYAEANDVQLTAIAAEYLLWWHNAS